MTMLQLAGPAAETAFRLSKLRAELRSLTDAIIDVGVRFEHYVHLDEPLTERELPCADSATKLRRSCRARRAGRR